MSRPATFVRLLRATTVVTGAVLLTVLSSAATPAPPISPATREAAPLAAATASPSTPVGGAITGTGPAPIGNFESVALVTDGVRVRGWIQRTDR